MTQYKTFDVNSFVTNIKTTYFEFIAIYYHTQTYKLLSSYLIKSMLFKYYLYTIKIFYYYFASAVNFLFVLSFSAFVIFLFSFSSFI